MEDVFPLAGLFIAAFIAATLLPAQSEAVLVAMLLGGDYAPAMLVTVATIGNVAGSLVNWLLGRAIEHFRHRRWFPVSERGLERGMGWYRRWGRWSLLLSWMPVVGDALTVAAGVMREPFWSFLLLVFIAKAGRYAILALAVSGFP